jgi:polyphosphate kinase 2 (PPK2 family)
MTSGKAKSEKMKRKVYEKALHKLQVELCHLQEWVKAKGLKVIIVFEGRDTAGKGGTIKAIMERVSPRVFRVVALPTPSDRQKSQLFMQRYFEYFPAAGEIVIFDRSWYNRLGVERVMGFVDDKHYQRFLELCPEIESYIVEGGIQLIKVWLEVGKEEQTRRFAARSTTPSVNGSSVRWTSLPISAGTTTPPRAMPCWRRPIPKRLPGSSCGRMTSERDA